MNELSASGVRRAGGREGTVAAVDLGATSGRVIVGRIGPDVLELRHAARFPNDPVQLRDGLHWDVIDLYRRTLDGLAWARREEPELLSVGIDSWAVDYALLRGGRMLGEPFHYRDEGRAEAGPDLVHGAVDAVDLYRRNGLQHLPFNTVFQLACDRAEGVLDIADTMLLIPDLLGYQLTGISVAERTNASTTGLLSAHTSEWDVGLARLLGVPDRLLPTLVDPGTELGVIDTRAATLVGAELRVVAVGSHDTASAVVALPSADDDVAYISCGTWALVGVEVEHPVFDEAARLAAFTNEGGVDGRVRFLHNVMGLWLLSESIRSWERADSTAAQRSSVLEELLAQAEAVERSSVPVFDVDDPRFLAPGNMPERIAAWCEEHGCAAPVTRAEYVRSIVESLAEAFAATVTSAGTLTGRRVSTIHIMGGGSQNRLLCQATADRSGLPVVAGPVEATAIGNLLVQARSAGLLAGSLEALRAFVARTQTLTRYVPARRSAHAR